MAMHVGHIVRIELPITVMIPETHLLNHCFMMARFHISKDQLKFENKNSSNAKVIYVIFKILLLIFLSFYLRVLIQIQILSGMP